MPSRILTYPRVLAVLTFTLTLSTACAQQHPISTPDSNDPCWRRIEPVGRYTFQGPLLQDTDLSGIACIAPTHCLIGADEGRQVQCVDLSIAEGVLTIRDTLTLLPTGREIDIEAVAADDNHYYIVGSHGLAKKSSQQQPNRYKIFRLTVDPATGLPSHDPPKIETATLAPLLQADATIGPYFNKPLQRKGLNIEALAFSHGRLFVGLRNPNLKGCAYVIELDPNDLFAGKSAPTYTLHQLALGPGLGIRDMAPTQTGFLLIAGNAGSEPSKDYPVAQEYEKNRPFYLFTWNGRDSQVHKIGPIPNAPAKAEAITILEESPDHLTVLILFDSAPQGRPTLYRIS